MVPSETKLPHEAVQINNAECTTDACNKRAAHPSVPHGRFDWETLHHTTPSDRSRRSGGPFYQKEKPKQKKQKKNKNENEKENKKNKTKQQKRKNNISNKKQ